MEEFNKYIMFILDFVQANGLVMWAESKGNYYRFYIGEKKEFDSYVVGSDYSPFIVNKKHITQNVFEKEYTKGDASSFSLRFWNANYNDVKEELFLSLISSMIDNKYVIDGLKKKTDLNFVNLFKKDVSCLKNGNFDFILYCLSKQGFDIAIYKKDLFEIISFLKDNDKKLFIDKIVDKIVSNKDTYDENVFFDISSVIFEAFKEDESEILKYSEKFNFFKDFLMFKEVKCTSGFKKIQVEGFSLSENYIKSIFSTSEMEFKTVLENCFKLFFFLSKADLSMLGVSKFVVDKKESFDIFIEKNENSVFSIESFEDFFFKAVVDGAKEFSEIKKFEIWENNLNALILDLNTKNTKKKNLNFKV